MNSSVSSFERTLTFPPAFDPKASDVLPSQDSGPTVPWLSSIGPLHRDHRVTGADRVLAKAIAGLHNDFEAANLDLRVTFSPDFLREQVEATGKFVPKAFDTKLKPVRHGDIAGFLLYDENGLAATNACRLYRLGIHSLADRFANLSLFYADPGEQMLPGERIWIDGDAERVAGDVYDYAVWAGCYWVRPDLRAPATNLSKIMRILMRVYAAARWGEPVTFSVVEGWIKKPGATSRIGGATVYERIWWKRPDKPECVDMGLMLDPGSLCMEMAQRCADGEDRLQFDLPSRTVAAPAE